MANWFRLTPDKSLDRRYLRICAVHRCMKRYGQSKAWGVSKLATVMSVHLAEATITMWHQSKDFPKAVA